MERGPQPPAAVVGIERSVLERAINSVNMLPLEAGIAPKGQNFWNSLYFGLGRGQFARGDRVVEAHPIVTSIAKRLVGALAATAQGDHGASGQSERGARRVLNLKISFNSYGSVA